MLNDEQKKTLLRAARASLEAAVNGQAHYPTTEDPMLLRPAAAFVSLHLQGELRGCIGTLEAAKPLLDTVVQMAREAALSDSRFSPVAPKEVPELHLEISVLTPAEPVTDPSEIEIGVHGLIVEQGRRRGLLLPQVAPEWGWDREELLEHTCLKAGLPRDAWRRGASLRKFRAEVFGEEKTQTS
jgi:AmmeMemoRadiSam system protein A